MNNPYHHHTTDLEITVAGKTVIHELRVKYTYYPGLSSVQHRMPISGEVYDVSPPEPAQVDIHEILERQTIKSKDFQTEVGILIETEYSLMIANSKEHIEAIEQEILERLE